MGYNLINVISKHYDLCFFLNKQLKLDGLNTRLNKVF